MPLPREASLAAAALIAVAALATSCTSPRESGLVLGEDHAEAIRADRITVRKMASEFDAAEAKYAAPGDRQEFTAGYHDALEPVADELAQMVIAESAADLGAKMGAIGSAVGEAIGEALREVERTAESITHVDGKTREEMREAGREVGRVMKGVKSALEAFSEGLEEEMDQVDDRR